MEIIDNGSTTIGFRGYSGDMDFTVNVSPSIVSVGNNPVVVSNPTSDLGISTITSPTVTTSGIVTVGDSSLMPGHSVTNLTPGYCTCTVSATNNNIYNCEWISNGIASIEVSTPVGIRITNFQVAQTGAASADEFTGYKSGSLALHVSTVINNLINGLNPAPNSSEAYYTGAPSLYPSPGFPLGFGVPSNSNPYRDIWEYNNLLLNSQPAGATPPWPVTSGSTLVAKRNPQAITSPSSTIPAGIDLSAVSVIQDTGGTNQTWTFPKMLISPRHVVCAAHVAGVTPTPYTWLGPDGVTTYTSNLVQYIVIENAYNGQTDLCIGFIDPPITGITPLKTLPANWQNYLPTVAAGSNPYNVTPTSIPVLNKGVHSYGTNLNSDALRIMGMSYTPIPSQSQAGTVASSLWVSSQPNYAPYQAWWNPVYSGDSSSPYFIPVAPNLDSNYQAVLLGCAWLSDGASPCMSDYITQINAAMLSLTESNVSLLHAGEPGTLSQPASYTLFTVSLANFTSY